jgi:SP family myo-inositol transporter-like MFS transporter 13
MLSDPPTRRALFLGCGMMAVQQFSGINTVMYYAASIYEMAGYDELKAVWLSGFTALAQVVGIAVSIFLVDRVGRRTLVLCSLGFVTVSLVGLALSFYWARIISGDVLAVNDGSSSGGSSGSCHHQPALVWDGVVSYCYDCVGIDGCGYCGNSK